MAGCFKREESPVQYYSPALPGIASFELRRRVAVILPQNRGIEACGQEGAELALTPWLWYTAWVAKWGWNPLF